VGGVDVGVSDARGSGTRAVGDPVAATEVRGASNGVSALVVDPYERTGSAAVGNAGSELVIGKGVAIGMATCLTTDPSPRRSNATAGSPCVREAVADPFDLQVVGTAAAGPSSTSIHGGATVRSGIEGSAVVSIRVEGLASSD
jgi:hypothetical protein